MTRSNTLGYVAAFPIPEVIRGINAFCPGGPVGESQGPGAGGVDQNLV